MITLEELQNLSRERLEDAKVLYEAERLKWAFYTCGYAVELALKKKICETLRWKGYPNTNVEFNLFKSFKTHDLDVLLHLSSVEDEIKGGTTEFSDWSVISSWDPEVRYSLEIQTKEQIRSLLDVIEILLGKL